MIILSVKHCVKPTDKMFNENDKITHCFCQFIQQPILHTNAQSKQVEPHANCPHPIADPSNVGHVQANVFE